MLRESFRTHQDPLIALFADSPDYLLLIMVVFRGDPAQAAEEIPTALPVAFSRLVDKIQEGSMPL